MVNRNSLLRELIASALPKRELAVQRNALILAIIERIEAWRAIKPLIKPHVEKVKKLVAIADKLEKAVKVADAALLKLGVDKEVETAKAERVALGAQPAQVPLGGYSAMVDLYLIPWRASDGLRKWNRLHRTPKHRPKELGPQLTSELHRLCCRAAGCTADEFEDFLDALNGNVAWEKTGLPKLASATLKKRTERSNKRAKDKVAQKSR